MLKIGIFTHYFKSTNYGGNLQAYALCEFLNSNGYSAQQISYNRKNDYILIKDRKKKHIFIKACRKLKYIVIRCLKHKTLLNIEKRNNCMTRFNQMIPHTSEKNKADLFKLRDEFDCFITGSDQVWHPSAVCDGYLLNFEAMYKMSYAASFSTKVLSDSVKKYYSDCLKTYDSISVREEKAVGMAESLSKGKAEWVLDPTMLLSLEDWDKVSSARIIKEKYLFCFFLGDLSFDKKIIQKYAKDNCLKIISMPYLTGVTTKGANFGDVLEYEVSPNDFLSLIKYAEYVFTDSFHATVFSHIFKKDFFVFNRKGAVGMNDRIYSLTSLFNTQDRFCDTDEKANLSYIENLAPVDYSKGFPKFDAMKEKSINYLKENLKRAEEKINGNK